MPPMYWPSILGICGVTRGMEVCLLGLVDTNYFKLVYLFKDAQVVPQVFQFSPKRRRASPERKVRASSCSKSEFSVRERTYLWQGRQTPLCRRRLCM